MSSIPESSPKLECCTTTGYKDRQNQSPKGSCWWHRSALGGMHSFRGLTPLTVTHGLREDGDSSSPCCHLSPPQAPPAWGLSSVTQEDSPRSRGQTVLRDLPDNVWATIVVRSLWRCRPIHGSVLHNICGLFPPFPVIRPPHHVIRTVWGRLTFNCNDHYVRGSGSQPQVWIRTLKSITRALKFLERVSPWRARGFELKATWATGSRESCAARRARIRGLARPGRRSERTMHRAAGTSIYTSLFLSSCSDPWKPPRRMTSSQLRMSYRLWSSFLSLNLSCTRGLSHVCGFPYIQIPIHT